MKSRVCRQSADGTLCFSHLQPWPCPVAELLVQLRCAARWRLDGVPGPALGHVERAIELADAIAGPVQEGVAG